MNKLLVHTEKGIVLLEKKVAVDGDLCMNPKGEHPYRYSDKDPGTGLVYVVLGATYQLVDSIDRPFKHEFILQTKITK